MKKQALKKIANYTQFFIGVMIVASVIIGLFLLMFGTKDQPIIEVMKKIFVNYLPMILTSFAGLILLRESTHFRLAKTDGSTNTYLWAFVLAFLLTAAYCHVYQLPSEFVHDTLGTKYSYIKNAIGIMMGILIGAYSIYELRYGITIALVFAGINQIFSQNSDYFKELLLWILLIVVGLILKFIFFGKWSRFVKDEDQNTGEQVKD